MIVEILSKIRLGLLALSFLFHFSNANAVCNLNAQYTYTDSMGHIKLINLSNGYNRATWHLNHTNLLPNNTVYLPVAGKYLITLTIYDTNQVNCMDTFMGFINSTGDCITQAGFKYSSENVGKNAAKFTNTTVSNRLKCLWNFGDGMISNDFQPLHQYLNAGTYSTRLLVYDSLYQWCSDSIELPVSVKECYVEADFTFIDTNGLRVFLNNKSKNASAYLWNFGDGSYNYNYGSVSHTYTNYSIRYVTLIAKDTINNFCS
ncbi:MAG: hypothetical protein IT245_05715, partial [Bacteroidia bacterium]|nr:hypothetical protein [Bacteroidia bacterium]